jgi:hypothetical protein
MIPEIAFGAKFTPEIVAAVSDAALAPVDARAPTAIPASKIFFMFILVIPLEVHLESQV